MKSILIIVPDIPYPLTKGGRQGVFHFIDKLRKIYNISLIFKAKANERQDYLDLKSLWNNVRLYPYFTPEQPINKQSLISKIYNFPYYCKHVISEKLIKKDTANIDFVRVHSVLHHSKPEIEREFVDFVSSVLQENKFDIIQVEFFPLISLIHILPSESTRIFVHHELGYIRNKIEMSFYKSVNSYDEYYFKSARHFEIGTMSLYDKVITVSEIDKIKLQEHLPDKQIYASPLIVGLKDISIDREYNFNNTLTYIANSDHFPNYDGIKWFLSDIWNKVLDEFPTLQLHIIGKGWNAGMFEDIGTIKNVVFRGYVKDLAEVIPNSISIIPIRIGSGMRMKILDAIHYNSPFVTTTIGVEGLDFIHNEDCLIADTANKFKDAISMLISSPNMQRQFVANSLNKLNNQYSEKKLIAIRNKIYED